MEEKWQQNCRDELEALLELNLVLMKPGQWEERHRDLAARRRMRVQLQSAWKVGLVDPIEMVQHFPLELTDWPVPCHPDRLWVL
jgi:hypothetical protein